VLSTAISIANKNNKNRNYVVIDAGAKAIDFMSGYPGSN
jgi:hypothetical protein